MSSASDVNTPAFADALVSTCRATLGDSLRSVVYFTPEEFELLYIRRDLYGGDTAQTRDAKAALVEAERVAFGPDERYNKEAYESETRTDFGEYEFTLRVFSEGFIGRVVSGTQGVLVTTDELELREFEEMEVAIRQMLRGAVR
ncbi:hypothetical protein ACFQJC_01790 [Haloferax namakaokahaiae]|uniref:Uncharacterized protein n=1 Tax=Haloferax namakaokahaiae TaxID=1748331 RepID=A0ABD5ZAM9_9EURY